MKKDRLYTVNRWNRPAFMPQRNLFWDGGMYNNAMSLHYNTPVVDKNYFQNLSLSSPSGGNFFGTQDAIERSKQISGNKGFASKVNYAQLGQTVGGALLSTPTGDKLLDTLDPTYHLAGGRESAVGNGMNDIGKGLFKAGVTTGNPWLMLGGAGAKVLGGLTNAAFGTKWNKENIKDVENNISNMRSSANNLTSVGSSSQLLNAFGNINTGYDFSNSYIGKDGWWSNKAKKKANNLRNQQNVARGYVTHALVSATQGVDKNTDDNAMSTFAAYGGPLEMMANNDGMGAIGYGLMSDYLNMKNNQAQNKGNMISYLGNMPSEPMTFARGGGLSRDKSYGSSKKPYPSVKSSDFAGGGRSYPIPTKADAIDALRLAGLHGRSDVKAKVYKKYPELRKHGYGGLLDNDDTFFALGGDVQTNGSDWTDGLTLVNAGQRHEQNPYQGVQMGIAPDGSPNLVEEGETIFNDYVFSDRIHPTKDVLKKFHMYSKGGKLTYADVSKRLEKEAKERPNDPISQASLKKMLEQLQEAQENQKAVEEAERARKAFEALSPEEQQQVLAQIAAQQQAENGGENGVENGGEVPVDENGNPIDAAIQQPTQPTEEEMTTQQNGDEGVAGAYGGNLNHQYKKGGWKDQLSDAYNIHSIEDWNKLIQNAGFKDFDFSKYSDDKLGYTQMIYELEQTLGDDGYNKLLGQFADDNAAFTHALKNGYSYAFNDDVKPGYDWNPFFEKLKGYDRSKTAGNVAGNYAVDGNFPLGDAKTIKDLEGLQSYKDFTDKVADFLERNKDLSWNPNKWKDTFSGDDLQIVNYLDNLMNGVAGSASNADMYMTNPDGTKSFVPNAAQRFRDLRNDQKGGIFHFTPSLMSTTPVTNNYTVNGSDVSDYIGTPTGTPVNTYTWVDDDGVRHTNNYYTNAAAPTDEGGKGKGNKDIEPIHKAEWPRYAGLFSPAIGLGLWAAGVGKPDYVGLDTAAAMASTPAQYASTRYVGDYEKYVPWDIWATRIANDATSRATDRAIINNNSPIGTKTAGLLANGYQSQIADANLQRQAMQLNDQRYDRTVKHNLGVNEFNAQAFNDASKFNAQQANQRRQYQASLAADIARTRLNGDAQWYNALYGNIGQIGAGLSELGRENATHNMIADMAANGVFGNMSPDTFIAKRYLRNKNSAAKGGKLKRKKGLTF